MRPALAAAAVTASASLVATPIASANYVAVGTDSANDVATGQGGHDIIGVALVFNPRTGDLRAQVRLQGAPSGDAPADLYVLAARRTATGCDGFPAMGFSTLNTIVDVRALRLTGEPDPLGYPADKDGGDTPIQEFETSLSEFRGAAPDCVIARTAQWDDTQVTYDTAGPFALRGVPALQLELGKVPSSLRPGQTRTVRATVSNPGHAKTGPARLSTAKARGLSVRHSRRIASIAPGERRTVALRVTLSAKAKTTTKLRVTAKAPNKLTASADARLYLRKPSSGGGQGGGGGGNPTKLCYRYTWYPPYGELVPC